MRLYAIDPGTEQSAVVGFNPKGHLVFAHVWRNSDMVQWLGAPIPSSERAHLVVEQVKNYGMAVGEDVFATVFWSGRFVEAWQRSGALATWSLLPRRDVKLHLCHSMRAKDANIRQALIDRYGGKACTKKGGALYGIKSHLWAALALAVTYQEQAKLEAVS